MYKIYVDDKLLYAAHLTREGFCVFSPKLTVELNKAGSLEFTLPPDNERYDDIQKLKSIITVNQNGEEMYRGRVLNDEKDFYKQKLTYCEGELAFFIDSIQRPYTITGTPATVFSKYITNHNSRVDSNKRFKVGNVTVTTASNITVSNANYTSTFDELQSLIDTYGGYLKTRLSGNERYIDWLVDSGEVCSQTIEFGRNLLDITEYISAENVFTVLIPLGEEVTDENGNSKGKLTVASANGGKDYIENEVGISLFGRIERTAEWSEITDAAKLLNLGTSYLNQNIEMAVTLTVRAVDMYILDVNMDEIRVGDWVRVISLPHRLDKNFQCTKIVYDLVNPDQNEYTFGLEDRTLTGQTVNSEKSIKSSVSTVLSAASAVNASVNAANKAASNAEQVIAQIPTEYVKTETFEAYKTTIATSIDELNTKIEELKGGNA